ncbi:hypothetical protein, partial [Dolichospermum circinale]|uniref:hypothetical protein n=1 Tax=Dolichospermum circinale TaxID=109265 RepID=UPI001E2E048C
VGVKNCRYDKGTGNREQGTGFGQLYFSLLMSFFSVHLLKLHLFLLKNIFFCYFPIPRKPL